LTADSACGQPVAGMSVAEFMARPPKGIATETKRQIHLAKTLKSFHKGGRPK